MSNGVIEVEFLSGTSYNTTSIPNHPILKEGMTAITYNETTGETTNVSNINETDWYSYVENKDDDMADGGTTDGGDSHWANAKVTVNEEDSYFVWIPRYAYRIIYFDSLDSENKYRAGTLTEEQALAENKIEGYSDARGIVDTEGKTKEGVSVQTAISVNDKYFKTHPAFDGNVNAGGWNTKLEGIWVAKYEASQGKNSKPKSVPGVSSWRIETIGRMFTCAKEYNTTLNSHMIKNSEWGAVAYFTESKYGRNGTEMTPNESNSYTTGGGDYVNDIEQSSTGNIYGIYDLSGGADEYVSSYYADAYSSNLENGSSFIKGISNEESTAYNGTSINIDFIYGDATYETGDWNDDCCFFFMTQDPFLYRGGGDNRDTSSGIFGFYYSSGGRRVDGSFRVSLVVK